MKQPKTLEEAISLVIAGMTKYDVEFAMESSKKDFGIELHHGFGTCMRNAFGLWGSNKELIDNIAGDNVDVSSRHGDTLSSIIIDAVWDRLAELCEQTDRR